MKTLLLILLIAAGGSAMAQAPDHQSHGDSLLSRWIIDINLMGGGASQTFTTANTAANYPNALNVNTGDLKYRNGYSAGTNAQVGFFFGHKRHFGLGTGVMFTTQHGETILDNYHVEYQATDRLGNTYRQVVTGHDVRDDITATSINIPFVLKYKDRFSKHWGFAADAGALINLQVNNAYTTEASFDYGAIYKLQHSGDGGVVSVYDNAPVASSGDWMITRAEFLKNNPNGNYTDYVNAKRALGYNVGEALSPNKSKGNRTSTDATVGFLIQPSFSYYLSDNAALNFGVYYMFQPFKSNAQPGYRVTEGIGTYNTTMNNVTASTNQQYGLNIGARFFIGRRDYDHDGVPDRRDKCPDVYGLAKFDGCPDTDGDGVQDSEDSCITVPGLAKFHGCPDTDGDGIADKDDSCPTVAGTMALHGCPDRDGDGIADKDDACPDVAGIAAFHGCPDTDGDGIPDKDDKCPLVAGPASNQGCPVEEVKTVAPEEANEDISKPILFDVNKTTIHVSSLPELDKAAEEMKEDRKAVIVIDGHADATGPESYNRVLSLKRANSVKSELTKRGVNPRRLKTKGHGSTMPTAPNDTYEGKMKNRRAVMTIKK